MRISKRGAFLVVAAGALTVLGGCSYASRVGVRADESGRPIVEIARCSGQRITSVELLDGEVSSAPLLWRVESDGLAVDSITVGETPAGFVEIVSLDAVLRSDTPYRVVVRSTKYPGGSETFTPSELATDAVLTNGAVQRLDQFRSRAGYSCGNGFGDLDVAAVIVIVIVVVGFSVVWAGGIVFWIVKLVQVARIPEHQYRAAGSDKTTWILVVVLAQLIGALVWQFGPRKRVLAAKGWAPPAPPGWYQGPAGWQWWNGQQWVPAAPPPAPPPPTDTIGGDSTEPT